MSTTSIAIAKQQATRLKTKLSALGVEIKHTQALEGIAAINNHNDWNSYLPTLSASTIPETPATAYRIEPYLAYPISLYNLDSEFTFVALNDEVPKRSIHEALCFKTQLRSRANKRNLFEDTGSDFSIGRLLESIGVKKKIERNDKKLPVENCISIFIGGDKEKSYAKNYVYHMELAGCGTNLIELTGIEMASGVAIGGIHSKIKADKTTTIFYIDVTEIEKAWDLLKDDANQDILGRIVAIIKFVMPKEYLSNLTHMVVGEIEDFRIHHMSEFISAIDLLRNRHTKFIALSKNIPGNAGAKKDDYSIVTNKLTASGYGNLGEKVYYLDDPWVSRTKALNKLLTLGSSNNISAYLIGLVRMQSHTESGWLLMGNAILKIIIECLVELRVSEQITLDLETIKSYMTLDKIVELLKSEHISTISSLKIERYLSEISQTHEPVNVEMPLDKVMYEQHGYRIMCISEMLNFMEDSLITDDFKDRGTTLHAVMNMWARKLSPRDD